MVDTSLAALRLLELIALLFPVVALLIQLQHRAVNSPNLEVVGLKFGIGLLALLSVSFLLLSLYLVSAEALPSLVSVPLLAVSFISLLFPLLIVLASKRFTDDVTEAYFALFETLYFLQESEDANTEEAEAEPVDDSVEQK